VLDEAARTFPIEDLSRLEFLAATQGSEAVAVVFAALADRATDEREVYLKLRFLIATQVTTIPLVATHATLDGLEVLYRILSESQRAGLEPLVRSIIDRAEHETDTVAADLLWELVKRILRKNDDLTGILVERTLSRAA
jgi:hypothetical protein